mgnify:CR=1 FL=1
MKIGDTIKGLKITGLFGGMPIVHASSDDIAVGDRVLIFGHAHTIGKIRKPSAYRIVVDFIELGYGMKFMRKRSWQKIEEVS